MTDRTIFLHLTAFDESKLDMRQQERATLYHMDCRDAMGLFMAENSVDSVVTDPPYGLGFMGKGWDKGVPGVEFWRHAYAVLKPGGYLLAFGGTRTYHRLVCAIEDAGFEVRDTIMWVYGSGFPKSHNGEWGGTALKPAVEPICVARKPLIGTVAANWSAHGTGALNIDGCRVGEGGGTAKGTFPKGASNGTYGNGLNGSCEILDLGKGRWPANLIHDGSDEVLAQFPETKSGGYPPEGGQRSQVSTYGKPTARGEQKFTSSEGSAARFFYCAKADKKDRGEGNTHPTVKPTDLMRYLVRLVTPPGGRVLDPFMGSGSTGVATVLEGFSFVGCEDDKESDSFSVATRRVRAALLTARGGV